MASPSHVASFFHKKTRFVHNAIVVRTKWYIARFSSNHVLEESQVRLLAPEKCRNSYKTLSHDPSASPLPDSMCQRNTIREAVFSL